MAEKQKTCTGHKIFDNSGIDAVTTIARAKARQHFGDRNILEVEAAMLSNHCRAVKLHQEKEWKEKRQSMRVGYKKKE